MKVLCIVRGHFFFFTILFLTPILCTCMYVHKRVKASVHVYHTGNVQHDWNDPNKRKVSSLPLPLGIFRFCTTCSKAGESITHCCAQITYLFFLFLLFFFFNPYYSSSLTSPLWHWWVERWTICTFPSLFLGFALPCFHTDGIWVHDITAQGCRFWNAFKQGQNNNYNFTK